MFQAKERNGNQPPEAVLNRPKNPARSDLAGHVGDVCTHAVEAADAQLEICTLKLTRAAVLTAFCIVAIVALAGIAAYGFFLLDGCLAMALSQSPFPAWFSSLARGLVYTLAPLAGLLHIWRTRVGFGARTN